ncbi:MAG TPA: oligoendopeptidase F [Chloroflexota bacterium]|nr:oligoendopeptidase F [Chloroflexota bacterium]
MAERLTRDHVPVEETWNLDDIYPSPEHWAADMTAIEQDIEAVSRFRGRLAEGASVLEVCLRAQETLLSRLDRLRRYAYFRLATDGISPDNQGMSARAERLAARVDAARSFIVSDLAELPKGTIERYLDQEPGIMPFRALLEDVERRRAHLLSPETETALAALGESLKASSAIWQGVTAVDMICPPIRDGAGQELSVSIAGYVFGHSHAADRDVRRAAYESLTVGLHRHGTTLASALAIHINQNVTLARLRGYASATEMILARQRVPLDVYENVLDVVHDEMAPHVRRLTRLRARVLGISEPRRYDLEAPLDPDYHPGATFDQCGRLIQEALRPLGDDYGALVSAAFGNRWIDRADNAGKRSGAFCWPVHGVHPYVFTTWHDALRSAFVLAHELGHAGHYTWTLREQPLSTVAIEPMSLMLEAPSTANELLLAHHLLDTAPDPRFRRWVILQSLGTFTHNMVTHLLEGRFERRLYQLAEAGKPLTLAVIMSVQDEIFERFFAGAVALDDGARLYWAQQPHFFMNHYSYTYAAGLASACAAVAMMRAEGQPAVDRWLEMLGLGATLPPVEILGRAGVDIAHPDTLRHAARYFGSLVDELEQSF